VAGTALIDRQRQYGDCISEAVATRLGDGTYMVKTPGLVSPLDGRPIEEIGVPGRWMDGEDPVDVAGVSQIGDEIWSIDVKSQLLTYSADGLHRPKKR
jgi:hypothetical protein